MSKKRKMFIIELGILLLVLIIFIIAKTKIYTIFPLCIIKRFFGIDCPSCGATRCVTNFVTGNWVESFMYHPFFFVTIIYLIVVNIVYIINAFRKKEILKWIYPKFKFWIVWTILLIIFAIVRILLNKYFL